MVVLSFLVSKVRLGLTLNSDSIQAIISYVVCVLCIKHIRGELDSRLDFDCRTTVSVCVEELIGTTLTSEKLDEGVRRP